MMLKFIRFSFGLAFICAILLLTMRTYAQSSAENGHWVSAWSTAVHTPLPFPGLPPTPIVEDKTIRMVVRPSIGGTRLKVRFSNEYGTDALKIASAHVAIVRQGGSIISESDRTLTFGGKASVSIPPGAPMLSDPIELKVEAFTELAVTIYIPERASATSTHYWAQHDTYISGSGDATADTEIQHPTVTKSWYWLADVEMWMPMQSGSVVAFGDSITDGVGAKQGDYADWPDMLAKRLQDDPGAQNLAVTNEGIGGNRILRDGAGVSALARFDRDVLAQPGVKYLIVLEAINDIGWPHMRPPTLKGDTRPAQGPFVAQGVTSDELIAGLRQIIDRAHEHGIKVIGATLTPFEGADYYSADGETTRQAVNQWIRTAGVFDAVADFDAATRDPDHPGKFRVEYQSGDHLHPSAAGYKAMADAIGLSFLKSAPGNAKAK